MVTIFNAAGTVGAVLVIVAYFANQQGWLRSDDWRFPTANAAGAAFILFSLYDEWNTAAAVIEVFWLAISLYGLARGRMKKGAT